MYSYKIKVVKPFIYNYLSISNHFVIMFFYIMPNTFKSCIRGSMFEYFCFLNEKISILVIIPLTSPIIYNPKNISYKNILLMTKLLEIFFILTFDIVVIIIEIELS